MHADEEGDWETDDEREATWRRMRAWGCRQSGRQMDADTYKQIKLKDTEIDTDIVTHMNCDRHSHTDCVVAQTV